METSAILAKRAEEIIIFLESYRGEYGWSQVIDLARAQFVDHEQQLELRALAELLLNSHTLAVVQNQLDDDRHQLHSGHLGHTQNLSVGHHYEALRYEACAYNHELRGFIEAHRENVDRYELTRWLATASGGHHQWAEGEITGAMSEIALHAALMGMPELKNLRYGTLEEDLHGYDFVADWQGRMVTVDAKTGYYHPLTERKHGHEHLEISVPRDVVQGFRLTRAGLDDLRRTARGALNWHGRPANHWSHHHFAYQPARA